MSGIIGSKLNIRGSGRIATLGTDGQVLTSSGAGVAAAFEDAAGGGLDWQAVETGSTMTAVAGEGYWIDTTSNACTITLPSSASNGDEIMFADYARNWGTNGIVIDSNGLNYQIKDDTFDIEYGTDGQALHIVYSDATNGWIPVLDKTVAYVPSKTYPNDNGIFAYGEAGSATNVSNLVSNTGVMATDVTGVGTARYACEGTEFTDKGIFGFGNDGGSYVSITNLVSNTGVVATDQSATTGSGRANLAGCEYGDTKGIFGFGYNPSASYNDITNLVSDTGVVATDLSGVGTDRGHIGACSYGGDKGIFGFGYPNDIPGDNVTNLVSNTGVVGSDVTGVGTARHALSACEYGQDKGIFGFGHNGSSTLSMTNLVSNTGVVATDVTGVGTARSSPGSCSYN